MKAIQVQKYGGPEVLTVVDVPAPTPKPNEAIVKIAASGVNFIDVYFREGRYPSSLPFLDGQEASGTVTEVGADVKSLKPGDRVAYTSVLGSYAEFAAVPEGRLVRVPDSVKPEQAAAVMLQGMTAHYLLNTTYPLQKGETALVHAAAGGVGLLLVQMAKQIGARVIGTAGTADKIRLALEAGADEMINYREQDFEAETKRLTGGKGVDVVYDGVGQSTFDKGLERAAAPRLHGALRGLQRRRRAGGPRQATAAEGLAVSHPPQPGPLHRSARRAGTPLRRRPRHGSQRQTQAAHRARLQIAGRPAGPSRPGSPQDLWQAAAGPVGRRD